MLSTIHNILYTVPLADGVKGWYKQNIINYGQLSLLSRLFFDFLKSWSQEESAKSDFMQMRINGIHVLPRNEIDLRIGEIAAQDILHAL